MLKLLICLLSATALAGVMLQLRQQRLELAYETADLHDQIRGQQSRLWNQQLSIAACTAPNAISQTVDTQGLKLVPQPRPAAAAPAVSFVPSAPPLPTGSNPGPPRVTDQTSRRDARKTPDFLTPPRRGRRLRRPGSPSVGATDLRTRPVT